MVNLFIFCKSSGYSEILYRKIVEYGIGDQFVPYNMDNPVIRDKIFRSKIKVTVLPCIISVRDGDTRVEQWEGEYAFKFVESLSRPPAQRVPLPKKKKVKKSELTVLSDEEIHAANKDKMKSHDDPEAIMGKYAKPTRKKHNEDARDIPDISEIMKREEEREEEELPQQEEDNEELMGDRPKDVRRPADRKMEAVMEKARKMEMEREEAETKPDDDEYDSDD